MNLFSKYKLHVNALHLKDSNEYLWFFYTQIKSDFNYLQLTKLNKLVPYRITLNPINNFLVFTLCNKITENLSKQKKETNKVLSSIFEHGQELRMNTIESFVKYRKKYAKNKFFTCICDNRESLIEYLKVIETFREKIPLIYEIHTMATISSFSNFRIIVSSNTKDALFNLLLTKFSKKQYNLSELLLPELYGNLQIGEWNSMLISAIK